VGNVCTVTWVAPTEDVAGSIKSVKLYRDYLGIGDDSGTLLTTVARTVTTYDDDITAVTANYYVFYSLVIEYQDGSLSRHGPSSAAVRR
jgi:hypothetical protein